MTTASQPSLTPAARTLLDEYVDSVRESIVHEAGRPYRRPVPEVTVDDLRDAFVRYRLIADKAQAERRRARRLKVQLLLSASGAITGTLAGSLAAFVNAGHAKAAALVGLVLLAAATGGGAVLAEWRIVRLDTSVRALKEGEQPPPQADNPLRIVFDVALLEAAARAAVAEKLGESRASAPLSQIQKYLSDGRIWNEGDIAIFRRISEARNDILHKGAQPFDPATDKVITQARQLLVRLNALPTYGSTH